jgi:hypothetical protein
MRVVLENPSMRIIRLLLVCSFLVSAPLVFAQWTDTQGNIYSTPSGTVGIGTTSPIKQFSVGNGFTGSIQTYEIGNFYGDSVGKITMSAYSADVAFWQTHPATGIFRWYFMRDANNVTGSNQRMTLTPTELRLEQPYANASLNMIGFYERSATGSTLYGFMNQRGSTYTAAPRQFNIGNNHVDGAMALVAGGVERVTIGATGKVGIGMLPSATHALSVSGDAHFSGKVTGGNIVAKYQDIAEWVPSTEELAAGTVVVLDPEHTNHVKASSLAYDTSVAGVVSAQPGLILGEEDDSKAMIATTGRVRVRVDARQHSIKIGDLLATSTVPGTAMKSEAMEINGRRFHQPGTIIGKALEPLEGGVGEILVLLSMQ